MRLWGALALLVLLPGAASAQAIILDSEITDYCERLVAPLRPTLPHTDDVSFVLLADDGINAFVTPEKVVHLNAGLFMAAKGSSDIQGVLGHEMGHVASQHFLRGEDEGKKATMAAIAGAVVGVGAAVAGAPQVAAAAMTGGQAGAIAQMLHFSREHEREADQRAIAALHAANLSVKGMVRMFETLRLDSQLSFGSLPPYLLTHPLPEDRLQSLERVAAAETAPAPKEGDPAFERILAKVYALSHTPGQTMRRYPGTDEPSQYARAIALGLQGKTKDAREALAPLLKAHPDDPFYTELAAQLSLESGDLAGAEAGFAKVVQAKPRLILPRYQLAEVQRNRDELKPALGNLLQVTRDWPVWASPWTSLGLVYGQMGNLPMSHLSLAQAALYSSDEMEARQQLNIAKHYLKGDAKAASGTVPLPANAAPKAGSEAQGWADALEERLKDVKARGR